MSQAQVAEAMGVSQQAVAKWERDDDPKEAWPKLARVLKVKLDYPAAPFEAVARREWFERRAAGIQGTKLRPSYGQSGSKAR